MPEVMSIEVDEEFDPRPQSSPFGLRDPEGNLNYGMIAGIAIAIVLVILLIIVVAKPFGSDPKPVKPFTWTPADPTVDLPYLETYSADSAMTTSVQNAFDAWAKFYTTGKLEDLSNTFDLTGAMYAKLVTEQPGVAAAPDQGFPKAVDLGPVGEVERKDNIFTVRVVSVWTKPGTVDGTTYKWDVDMKAKNGSYILVTVRETLPTDTQMPVYFCDAAKIIAQLEDNTVINDNQKKVTSEDDRVKTALDLFTIREKAWQLLETSVAGTDSQEAASLIVDEYSALIDASKEDGATWTKIVESQNTSNEIKKARADLVERAKNECEGADISSR